MRCFLIINLVFLFSLNAKAQNVLKLNNSNQQGYPLDKIAVPKDIDENFVENLTEYELLNTDNKTITWPALPQIRIRREMTNTFDAEVSVGATLMKAGVKAAFHYQYNVKTALWLISSNRSIYEKSNVVKSNYNMASEEDFFIDGEIPGAIYPNVRDGHPIVGICIYEISLNMSDFKRGGFDIFGNGGYVTKINLQDGAFAIWSNFFNTNKNVPIDKYLNANCGNFFNKNVKEYTERNFSKLALNMYSLYNPKNKCSIQEERTSDGDTGCMAWHAKFGQATRNSTIPRCEMNADGVSRCVLKSKRQASCTLWKDDRGELTEENPNKPLRLATKSTLSNGCDYGLQCRVQEPKAGSKLSYLKNALGFRKSAMCE